MDPKRAHNALIGSLDLWQSGHHNDARQLMDDVIAEAIKEADELWVFAFIDHAAILGGFRDGSILKHYYEQYLIHSPENARALYGLADVAMDEGQTEIAKQYAKKCYGAILRSGDERTIRSLLELVLARWPDVAVENDESGG